jgi:hypothetical protein
MHPCPDDFVVAVHPVMSVIIPVRNGMPWLEEQLRALDAQVCEEPWEVVISDNGSTDGSLAFARNWAEHHPRVLVVDSSGIRGTSAGSRSPTASSWPSAMLTTSCFPGG